MKLYFTLTRRSAAAVLAALLLTVFCCGEFFSAAAIPENADTHAKRMAYLQSLNVAADDTAGSEKQIIIPINFSAVYEKYNRLQQKAGFDLSAYKGCRVTLYTYPLSGKENMYIHLLVYRGRVIGGDISETSLHGEMKPLQNQKFQK